MKLLLEHGARTSIENCNNKTAAQLGAFVGITYIHVDVPFIVQFIDVIDLCSYPGSLDT